MSSLPSGVVCRIKCWLNIGGDFLMGPRYVRLLEGIDATGTIRAACSSTGLSYRTCVKRIRAMERRLGAPVLSTQRGGATHGHAQLTPLARRLVRLYRAWRQQLEAASDRAFRSALRGAVRNSRRTASPRRR